MKENEIEGDGHACMVDGRMRTEGAEVEVLVAGDAADARLPTPVLVVPACQCHMPLLSLLLHIYTCIHTGTQLAASYILYLYGSIHHLLLVSM